MREDEMMPNGPLQADTKDSSGSDKGGQKETGRAKKVEGKKEQQQEKKKDG